MIRIDEVRERIDASVPALTGKLFNAGDWANVIEKNHLPQVTPAGFVLPGGIEGGQAQMAAGAFIQPIRDTVIVVVAVSHDAPRGLIWNSYHLNPPSEAPSDPVLAAKRYMVVE